MCNSIFSIKVSINKQKIRKEANKNNVHIIWNNKTPKKYINKTRVLKVNKYKKRIQ